MEAATMNRFFNRLFLNIVFVLLFCCGAPLQASHITMQISATPLVRDNQLHCTVTIINQGNERADSVQIHLDFRGQRHSSDMQPYLNIGESYTTDFAMPVVGLSSGRHPLVVILDYTDTNGYPFTALSSTRFFIGEDNPPKIHGAIEAIQLVRKERLELRVKNLDDTPREVSMRLILPREISSPRIGNQISLSGSGEQTVRFQLENFSALEGSTYQVFILMEYDDRGKHSCLFTPGTVTIAPSRDLFSTYKVPILVGVAILFVIFVGLQFRTYRKPS